MTLDFTPLFRTAIGFDRFARLLDALPDAPAAQSYPPYNIEKVGDDSYRLVMAVAGFNRDNLDLTVKENTLVVTGRAEEQPKTNTLYRGIASRAFERRFALADHIAVEGADLQDGILVVALKRIIPEALKPRKIEIGTRAPASIEQQTDAAVAHAA